MHLFSSFSVLLLALASTAGALASDQLPTVQVSAGDGDTIEIDCRNPRAPDSAAVAKMFGLQTDEQANRLRFKLAKVAAEACAAGTAHILVDRSGYGRELSWTAVN